jgi:mannosyltransferase OCH1-like enzyme
MIPPIIYRTWKTQELCDIALCAWQMTEKVCPNMQQVLFTDEDIDIFWQHTALPARFKRAYYRINKKFGAARADVFRYALLYERGGIYMDSKSYATSDLTDLLYDSFVLSLWQTNTGHLHDFCRLEFNQACFRGEYLQWFIAARPRHPFLYEVLDVITTKIEGFDPKTYPPGKDSVLRLTGPTIYTIVIENMIKKGFKEYRLLPFGIDKYAQYSITQDFDTHKDMYASIGSKHYSDIEDEDIVNRES